jgi:hypothetical protein
MKKAALGIGAALVAVAAFANDPNQDTKVAAVDANSATFAKLDADTDGRVSALEAANDTKVATQFTTADADKDGYLSKEEFGSLGKAEGSTEAGSESATEPTETPKQ